MPSPRLFGLHSSKHRPDKPEMTDLAEESEQNGPRENSIANRALADLWRRASEAGKKPGA